MNWNLVNYEKHGKLYTQKPSDKEKEQAKKKIKHLIDDIYTPSRDIQSILEQYTIIYSTADTRNYTSPENEVHKAPKWPYFDFNEIFN